MVYLLCFGISTICVAIGENVNHKTWSRVLQATGVVLLALLAGLRSGTVGTDTYYYQSWFLDALNYHGDFSGYYNNFVNYNQATTSHPEILTEIYFYCLSYVTNNVYIMQSLTHLIICGMVFWGISIGEEARLKWFAWLCFCLLFFNTTLNITRQMVALSVLFFAFSDIEKYKWWKGLLACIIAFGIHSSASYFIAFWFLYEVYRSKCHRFIKYLLVAISVCFPLFERYFYYLRPLFQNHQTALGEKIWLYLGQARVEYYNYRTPLQKFLVMLPFVVLIIKEINEKKNSNIEGKEFFYLSLAGNNITTAIYHNLLNSRINVYVGFFEIQFISNGLSLFDKKPCIKKCVMCGTICAMVIFWYAKYALRLNGETLPYTIGF